MALTAPDRADLVLLIVAAVVALIAFGTGRR